MLSINISTSLFFPLFPFFSPFCRARAQIFPNKMGFVLLRGFEAFNISNISRASTRISRLNRIRLLQTINAGYIGDGDPQCLVRMSEGWWRFQVSNTRESGRMFPSWKINDWWGGRHFSFLTILKVLSFCVFQNLRSILPALDTSVSRAILTTPFLRRRYSVNGTAACSITELNDPA